MDATDTACDMILRGPGEGGWASSFCTLPGEWREVLFGVVGCHAVLNLLCTDACLASPLWVCRLQLTLG